MLAVLVVCVMSLMAVTAGGGGRVVDEDVRRCGAINHGPLNQSA